MTFLWRGEPDVTRHVSLCGPLVLGATGATGGVRLAHIAETDIWHLTLLLPAQTRGTYVLSPNGRLGPAEDLGEWVGLQATWVRDPLNMSSFVIPENPEYPELTPRVYSLLEAPDAPAQRWRLPQPGVAQGTLEEHVVSSSILQNTRRTWTYTPPGWAPEGQGYPLLIAFDGWEAVHTANLPTVLDNLIAAGEIPPVVAVLVDCGTLEMRGRELGTHDPFLAFLTDEVLPWAADKWNLALDRSTTLVAGESMGGRAAVHAGLRRPDVFGKAIAQAAAVTAAGTVPIDALTGVSLGPASPPVEFAFDIGLLELDDSGDKAFLAGVRQLTEVLRTAGHTVHHRELACGHDGIVYGESIADALRVLLQRI